MITKTEVTKLMLALDPLNIVDGSVQTDTIYSVEIDAILDRVTKTGLTLGECFNTVMFELHPDYESVL